MQTARRSKTERGTLAALVAVFALVVQAMLPAAAMASSAGSDDFGVICTSSGAATISSPGPAQNPAKGFAGMPCQDCLAAALAVISTPELAVRPVAYTVALVQHQAADQRLAPRARAPPRPPGQGPPTA